jgi:hypothetical protein
MQFTTGGPRLRDCGHYPELTRNAAWRCLANLDGSAEWLAAGHIHQAIEIAFESLNDARDELGPAEWPDFARGIRQHELWDLFCQDPLTGRAYAKPRGYAGDAVMMDYIYGIHHYHPVWEGSTGVGRAILSFIQQGPAGGGVRWRREHIAQTIDNLAVDRRPRVLAIAAGHLREAEVSRAVASGRVERFVALDADAQSVQEVQARYRRLGVEAMHASVRHILARKCDLRGFDFVYAAGLFDYLSDSTAAALTARMFEMTAPGGMVMIPNFAPAVPERAYMESFMDWHLIYRDEYDMAKLTHAFDPGAVRRYDVYSDPTGAIVYLVIEKAN